MDGVAAIKVVGPPHLDMTGLYDYDNTNLGYVMEAHKEHELNEITFQKHSFLNNKYIFNKTTTYHSLVFKPTIEDWPSNDEENYDTIRVQIIEEYANDYAWKSHIFNKIQTDEQYNKYKNNWKTCRELQLLVIARFRPNQLEDKINELNDIYSDIQFKQSKIETDEEFVKQYHKLLPDDINRDYSSDTAYIIMYQRIPQEIYDNILCMPSNISYVYMEDSRGYSPFTIQISDNRWTSTELKNPCRLCLITQVTNHGDAQYCENCNKHLCTHNDCNKLLKNNITQVILSQGGICNAHINKPEIGHIYYKEAENEYLRITYEVDKQGKQIYYIYQSKCQQHQINEIKYTTKKLHKYSKNICPVCIQMPSACSSSNISPQTSELIDSLDVEYQAVTCINTGTKYCKICYYNNCLTKVQDCKIHNIKCNYCSDYLEVIFR